MAGVLGGGRGAHRLGFHGQCCDVGRTEAVGVGVLLTVILCVLPVAGVRFVAAVVVVLVLVHWSC